MVPYATIGSNSGVTATGPYQIEGTATTFNVSNDAIEQGLTIN
ncbi:MAG: hypothetical protein WCC86_07705 [Methanoregula sp.]